MQKLKIEKKLNQDKIAKGIFQQNLNFLQWLFAYATSKQAELDYAGYERRLQFTDQMASHLIPNEEFLRQDQQQRYEEQLNSYVINLERDLRMRMESNYRLMGMLQKFTIQRNLEYSILRRIEKQLTDRSALSKQLHTIISEVPFDFHLADE